MLRYLGQGNFTAVSSVDRKLADKLPVGKGMLHDVKSMRSHRQNRFLFALFGQALANQREGSKIWESVEHLKAEALCAIGYCTVRTVEPKVDDAVFLDFVAGLVEGARRRGYYCFVSRVTKGVYQIKEPKSWAFDKLTHEQATELMQPLLEWLCSDDGPCPGLNPEDLAHEARSEAA